MKKRIVSVLCVATLMSVIVVPSMGAEPTEVEDGALVGSEVLELSDNEGRQVIGYKFSNDSEDNVYAGIVVELFDKSGDDIGTTSVYVPCVAPNESAFIYVTNYFGEDYAEFSIKTTEGVSDYVSATDDLADLDIIEDDNFLTCTAENNSSETVYLPQITIVYTLDSEPTAVSTGMLKADGSTELCLDSGQTGTADIACPEEYDDYEYYVTAMFDKTAESEVESEPVEEESGEAEETSAEDQDSDRYIKQIKNYVGMNAASVGYLSLGGEIRDSYGNANIKLVFLAEDGIYLEPQNEDELKNYTVIGQMPAAGSEMHLTYRVDSDGEEYSNLVDEMSYDEIVLVVAPVKDNGIDYKVDYDLTEINASPDKYTKYVPDFVGRNLASCGYISLGGELRAESGNASFKLNIIADDGSYIDPTDREEQMQYVVTSQFPEPNTENDITFKKDSDGNEYSNLIDEQTVENVDLYVTKLPQEVIDAQPALIAGDED